MSIRILVAGGRDYVDREAVWKVLDRLHRARDMVLLIHGGAPGADTLAGEWARAHDVPERVFYVSKMDWRVVGRVAGPRRNARMLAEGKPDGVVAFPGGRGTADMMRQAIAAGITVWQPLAKPNA